jgi:hypothetical protein
VKETRARILAGAIDVDTLRTSATGEIKAQIVERDGEILMEKTCPIHGTVVDVLSNNPSFWRGSSGSFPAAISPPKRPRSTITARRRSSTGADRSSPWI